MPPTNLRTALLEHLNKHRSFGSFPGIMPLGSLDEIRDGVELLTTSGPDHSTLYLLTGVKVETRFDGVVRLNCSGESQAHRLEYDVITGKLFFSSATMRVQPGLALIAQSDIEEDAVYRAYRT